MPDQLWFTAFLNHYLAGPVTALLRALHVPPQYPAAPITNAVAMEALVFGFLLLMFVLVRLVLSVENPGGLQHMFEGFHGFIEGQSRDLIDHHPETFTSFLVTLGMFILFCNLIGLIPGFESPTGVVSVPFGCAVLAFVYYHFYGFRRNGIGYLKQFLGPVLWLAPLMVLIEIISHIARVLSLTVRLYANMFAGDMIIWVWFSLIPLGVPIVFLGLHAFVALIQAYIFVLLTIAYLAGAVAQEH